MTELSGWQNFYVIVGSSAGALIGLQFVVLTLIANRPAVRGQGQAGDAFATPTIVHFATVLLLAAIATAPWHRVSNAAILWFSSGVAGFVYEAIVVRRMRRQTIYKPEFEDWLFHALLPLVAYAIMAGLACVVRSHTEASMFGIAADALLLLFIGIHNAWDGVTYHVFHSRHADRG